MERVSLVRPSVRLCPTMCYQTVCNISMNPVRDGLTILYRTRTNFVPKGREKGWVFIPTGNDTFRWAPWQLVTLFVWGTQQPIWSCVTDVGYLLLWCCLLIGADWRQSCSAVYIYIYIYRYIYIYIYIYTAYSYNKVGTRYVQQWALVQSRSEEFMRDNGYMTPSFAVTGLTAQYNSVGNKNSKRYSMSQITAS